MQPNRERPNGRRQRLPDAYRKGRANVGYETKPGKPPARPPGSRFRHGTLRRR